MSDRWEPTPVPRGDGRHDIGDDTRALIARRLISDFEHVGLPYRQSLELAMLAAASVRALFHELGTLRDLSQPADRTELERVVSAARAINAQLQTNADDDLDDAVCRELNEAVKALAGPQARQEQE